jgi:hypothetical protein
MAAALPKVLLQIGIYSYLVELELVQRICIAPEAKYGLCRIQRVQPTVYDTQNLMVSRFCSLCGY